MWRRASRRRILSDMAETRADEVLAEAAARLAHDLGKAVRFSAPRELETDTESLRARLRADVCATRRGPEGPAAAHDVFAAWRRTSGADFAGGPLAEELERLSAAVGRARRLAERLDAASRAELEELDAETRRIAEGCRRLRDAARALGGAR